MRGFVIPRSFVRVGRRGIRRRALPFLLLVLPALAGAQSHQVLSPAYEAVVRRYASGNREGAIADMAAWPEGRLRDEITALNALWQKARGCNDCAASNTWERTRVTAALMLHTDCAIRARRDGSLRRPLRGHAARVGPRGERAFYPGTLNEKPPVELPHVRALRHLAEVTGGRFWPAASPDRLADAFLAILEAMKTRYVLRFEPDRVKREGLHELDVKLTRRKGKVYCRKAYFVGSKAP